jgi:hypothetical protein
MSVVAPNMLDFRRIVLNFYFFFWFYNQNQFFLLSRFMVFKHFAWHLFSMYRHFPLGYFLPNCHIEGGYLVSTS